MSKTITGFNGCRKQLPISFHALGRVPYPDELATANLSEINGLQIILIRPFAAGCDTTSFGRAGIFRHGQMICGACQIGI
jgi:hypothetical protein